MSEASEILRLRQVQKRFKKSGDQNLLVLDGVNFELREGEIVAILGKSGAGKSTLLRIIAGLIPADSGLVMYRGSEVKGPVQNVSMVFQNFALMPWLTVLQNVELGLEALRIPRAERRARALEAIDTIGLDGFESAFPKELSGGMQQRVGIARALVVNPDMLIMDEPFSALDVLTAENLRNDLLNLWQENKTQTKGILLVTHSIEEAVSLADRIVIFSSDPGSARCSIDVNLEHPRDESTPKFRHMVDYIYTLMTTREGGDITPARRSFDIQQEGLGFRLPDAGISEAAGLLETLIAPEYNGRMDLPELSEISQMDLDDLLPLNELLEIFQFAEISKGDIEITEEGRAFIEADILQRKQMFSECLKKHIPLARHIRQVLDARLGHRVHENFFLEELQAYFSEDEAERVLKTMISWGRYAELFAYDQSSEEFSLENPGGDEG